MGKQSKEWIGLDGRDIESVIGYAKAQNELLRLLNVPKNEHNECQRILSQALVRIVSHINRDEAEKE